MKAFRKNSLQRSHEQASRLTLAGGLLVAGAVALALPSAPAQAEAATAKPLLQKLLRGKAVRGVGRGGAQPIAGSIITLYAAGTSGYGQAQAIGFGASNAQGQWAAFYSCPAGNPQVYAVARGGDAGAGYNTAIGLSAALGRCNSLQSQAITISEATTVASVYALAQFLNATGLKPGTSAGNVTGLNNAVGNFSSLADLATGDARSLLPNGVPGSAPAQTVNTLANVLLPCVESSGPTSAQCSALFSATTVAGVAPSTTVQAALNIARNPGRNVQAIYALADLAGVFQPVLPAAPHDWTVAVSYEGGALNPDTFTTGGLAVDALGNVWVAQLVEDGNVSEEIGSVLKLGPQGAQLGRFTDNGNMGLARTVSVDATGEVWVAHSGGLSGLASNGASLSGSPFTGGGLASPRLVSNDAAGNVWASNSSSVTKLDASLGYAAIGYGLAAGGSFLPNVTGLALDDAGNVWTADSNNAFLVTLDAANPAQQIPGSPFSGGGLSAPAGIAIDAQGNVWAANRATNNASNGVTKFVRSGSSYTAVNYAGNGVFSPAGQGGAAVDGAGKFWVANNAADGSNGLAVVAADGTAVAGAPFTLGQTLPLPPGSLAIDASGSVWVGGGFATKVVQVIGAAVPVQTPVVGQARLP